MPTPIPDWDQFRVMMVYLLKRQIRQKPTNLKLLSNRMGDRVGRLKDILEEYKVIYNLIEIATVSENKYQEILISKIPDNFLPLFGHSKRAIEISYLSLISRKIEIKEVSSRWEEYRKKKERERMKRLRYFLREPEDKKDGG